MTTQRDPEGTGRLTYQQFKEGLRSAELGLTRKDVNLILAQVRLWAVVVVAVAVAVAVVVVRCTGVQGPVTLGHGPANSPTQPWCHHRHSNLRLPNRVHDAGVHAAHGRERHDLVNACTMQ